MGRKRTNQTKAEERLTLHLPKHLANARTDLWDDGPLWDRESAQVDFHQVYRAGSLHTESNTFPLQSRPFPGTGSWRDLGRFPAHYYNHILLINFMHAWCRDLLELGRWEFLNSLDGKTPGVEVKESAMRLMRYLSRLREEFLLVVAEYRKTSGDRAFSVSYRVPTLDLHLLATFSGCSFSLEGYDSFLKEKSGFDAFCKDPISLDWEEWRKNQIKDDLEDPDAALLGCNYVCLIPSYKLQEHANFAPMPAMVQFVKAYYETFGSNERIRNFKPNSYAGTDIQGDVSTVQDVHAVSSLAPQEAAKESEGLGPSVGHDGVQSSDADMAEASNNSDELDASCSVPADNSGVKESSE